MVSKANLVSFRMTIVTVFAEILYDHELPFSSLDRGHQELLDGRLGYAGQIPNSGHDLAIYVL